MQEIIILLLYYYNIININNYLRTISNIYFIWEHKNCHVYISYYECISCSEDDSIIEEFCGKGFKKSRMDRYDSVFEELEKGKVFIHAV